LKPKAGGKDRGGRWRMEIALVLPFVGKRNSVDVQASQSLGLVASLTLPASADEVIE
jgi:hypothetical protein